MNELEKIAEEIRNCRKCDLWKGRTKAVPGEGNPQAKLMIVGEAPGEKEDLEGRPFVGTAGKLLTKLLNDVGINRRDVFITNVVKCRPPGNRDPRQNEIRICSTYLDRQIKIIRPKMILALGRHSTSYFLSKIGKKSTSIMAIRTKIFTISINGMRVKVFPTLHPAAALYNPRLKSVLQSDFRKLSELLRVSLSERSIVDYFTL
ncbi:MAG: uracil-DNA glycosylase [Thermoprotei archaeon]|nr:MAG: uracil-DNA glycosylase [Thermoprotei archaeon]